MECLDWIGWLMFCVDGGLTRMCVGGPGLCLLVFVCWLLSFPRSFEWSAAQARRVDRMPKCFECGENGPYGFRLSGAFTRVPEAYRGYLWSCSKHVELAEARRVAGEAKARAEGLIEPEQISLGGWLRDGAG